MKKQTQKSTLRAGIKFYKQKGITLLELMIALVLSSIVIAAVLINVATVGRTSVVQRSQSEMIEDGQYALRILTNFIRNAGYSQPSEKPDPFMDRTDRFGAYLLGCSESEITNGVATDIKDWGATCTGSSGGSQAIATRYQAGEYDSTHIGSVTQELLALDCAGYSVDAHAPGSTITVDGKVILIVDNRLYIKNGMLMCRGNSDISVERPLMKTVEHMEFLYGVSKSINKSGFELLVGENSGYMTAAQLQSAFPTESEKVWDRVTSVRVCLIVRSRNPVPTAVQPYINCAGNSTPITDGYFRKAMLTTIEIANMGSGLTRN